MTYCGFLPGLSYFKPAIPKRPVDRGATNDAFSHFIPTDFDTEAGDLIGAAAKGLALPVVCSEPLVESAVIESDKGTVISLVNWSAGDVNDLSVTVNFEVGSKASLAGGGKLGIEKKDGKTVFKLDLELADAIILRR